MEQTKQLYQQLIDQYNSGISRKDPSAIRQFIRNDQMSFLIGEPDMYLSLMRLRAGARLLFGELDEAGGEYKRGLEVCDQRQKWALHLDWALVYLAELSLDRGKDQRDASFETAVEILDKGLLCPMKHSDEAFQRLTLVNLKAFLLLCMGKQSEAVKAYKGCSFVAVPIKQYNDSNSLKFLFSHLVKGLMVAIECNNVPLLMNLLRVISIDDEILMQEQNLFRLVYQTLLNTFDLRPEFSDDFNALYRQKEKLNSLCPQGALFLHMIGGQDFKGLDGLFSKMLK